MGAALSVIHKTGPLSDDEFYKQHMEFASSVLSEMSKIGGPRCCKRNAFLSLTYGAKFVKEHYGVEMQTRKTVCEIFDFQSTVFKRKMSFLSKSKGIGRRKWKKRILNVVVQNLIVSTMAFVISA